MPSRDSPSSRAMPTPPDWTATPAVPGCGCPAANVASRDAGLGVGDAEAVGADEPHAVRRQTASRAAPGLVQPRGDHEQGPNADAAALLGHLRHRGGRYGEHRQVGRMRQLRNRGIARGLLDDAGVRIDRPQRAGEGRVAHVAEHRPPHRPGGAPSSHDRH